MDMTTDVTTATRSVSSNWSAGLTSQLEVVLHSARATPSKPSAQQIDLRWSMAGIATGVAMVRDRLIGCGRHRAKPGTSYRNHQPSQATGDRGIV